MAGSNLVELKDRFGECLDVRAALALLAWDQEVYMPPKAAAARGRQLATLAAMAHRLLTSPEMARLLDEVSDVLDTLAPDDARLVEEIAYEYQRATDLPEAFVERFAGEQSKAYEAWVRARQASDFQTFRPHLETMVELLRQKADYHGFEDTPYDALIEDYERGMSAVQLDVLFAELAPKQSALVQRIVNNGPLPDAPWLRREWNEQRQSELTLRVLKDMGYDFDAGRQDKSVHPFTTNFGLHDVRVTTRFSPHDPFSALTGSMHEGGHALYEQGYPAEYERTVLADAPSLGIHESQSRMWENLIGRSLPFWKRYTPLLSEYFPENMAGVGPEDVYRALNRVQPSLIRVEADECTYNLHVILRYEIERGLIEGDLTVGDVPALWNEKVKQYLGIDVPDDAHGCLQDIHWSHGSMGYFPTYALGNLYAAQLFEKVLEDVPRLLEHVEQGEFAPLLAWLRTNVHQHGRRKSAVEIVRDASGKEPSSGAFMRYLEQKYGTLYGL